MIEQLFGSKTRVKLLQLFLSNPNRAFYVREITRKIGEQINSVRRELANMLSVGVITSDSSNNKLYYEVNQKFEHYGALKSIFGTSSGTVPKKASSNAKEVDDTQIDIVAQLRLLGAVDLAFLSGTFTRDNLSPVDLLIVGDVNNTRLKKFVNNLEKEEGREIRYSSMTSDEFEYRIDVHDRFISDSLASKKTILIDDKNRYTKKPSSKKKKK